ncbi:MAG: hypothetical protein ACOX7N_01190 [Lawsonibacter sp.]|jgi:hypothetical protein
MRTIFYQTANITSQPNNVVDLATYRQELDFVQTGSLAPQSHNTAWTEDNWSKEVEEETFWERSAPLYSSHQVKPSSVIPGPWAPVSHCKIRNSHPKIDFAGALELWASAGVIVMTVSFTLRLLLA